MLLAQLMPLLNEAQIKNTTDPFSEFLRYCYEDLENDAAQHYSNLNFMDKLKLYNLAAKLIQRMDYFEAMEAATIIRFN